MVDTQQFARSWIALLALLWDAMERAGQAPDPQDGEADDVTILRLELHLLERAAHGPTLRSVLTVRDTVRMCECLSTVRAILDAAVDPESLRIALAGAQNRLYDEVRDSALLFDGRLTTPSCLASVA
jgi:hypothetical protein